MAENLYAELVQEGIETLLDDREESPGAKFKDADLIGIPLRITIGPRAPAGGARRDPLAENRRGMEAVPRAGRGQAAGTAGTEGGRLIGRGLRG